MTICASKIFMALTTSNYSFSFWDRGTPSKTPHIHIAERAMNSLEHVKHLKVELTTLIDETIGGTIYAFSPKQQVIALKTARSSTDGKDLFRIINSSFIKSISVIGSSHERFSDHHENFKGRPIDLAKLESRLNLAVEKFRSSSVPPVGTLTIAAPASTVTKSTGMSIASTNRAEPKALALRVYDELVIRFGKENVLLLNNDSVLLFKEITICKPYALNRISNSKRSQSSMHLEKVKGALREIWLLGNNSKQGG